MRATDAGVANDAYEVVGEDGMSEDSPEFGLNLATGDWGMRNVDADKLSPVIPDADSGREDEGTGRGDEANPGDSTDSGDTEADVAGNTNSGITDIGKVTHSGDEKLDNDLNSSEEGGDIEF